MAQISRQYGSYQLEAFADGQKWRVVGVGLKVFRTGPHATVESAMEEACRHVDTLPPVPDAAGLPA
jgi:hypothetical protein